MNITADTNLLIRVAVEDDEAQAKAAARLLEEAAVIAIPVAVFCELAWILRRGCGETSFEIGGLIARLLNIANVATDVPAVEAGLAALAAGGDFADGAIAHQGRAAGGQIFASFDRKARRLLEDMGYSTICP